MNIELDMRQWNIYSKNINIMKYLRLFNESVLEIPSKEEFYSSFGIYAEDIEDYLIEITDKYKVQFIWYSKAVDHGAGIEIGIELPKNKFLDYDSYASNAYESIYGQIGYGDRSFRDLVSELKKINDKTNVDVIMVKKFMKLFIKRTKLKITKIIDNSWNRKQEITFYLEKNI